MIREYLKLARSFNAVLTALSPVMGAIAMEQYNIGILFILFIIGFFGHTYGFVFNDIVDSYFLNLLINTVLFTNTNVSKRTVVMAIINPNLGLFGKCLYKNFSNLFSCVGSSCVIGWHDSPTKVNPSLQLIHNIVPSLSIIAPPHS